MMTFSAFCARCRKKVKKAERIIRYFDMFAGVGGFRAGLDLAGGFQCIGHCEIDKYADASYRAIHAPGKEEVYYPDARTIDPKELPDFDLLCGGFPCQAFSTAGRRKGFEDARGTLFFELARVVKEKRPPYLFLENVPGLLSHDRGRTFGVILSALYDLGYHVEWTVLNSKHFGVPQSRRRLFLIGYLDPRCAGKILPVFGTDAKALVQIVHGRLGKRVYDSAGIACTQDTSRQSGLYFVDLTKGDPKITANARGLNTKQDGSITNFKGQNSGVLCVGGDDPSEKAVLVGFNRKEGVVDVPAAARTLNASDFRGINRNQTQNAVLYIKEATKKGYKEAYEGDSIDLGFAGSNTCRGRVFAGVAHTVDTANTHGIVMRGGRVRRLMPRECFRLQGFSEDQIDKILAITSDAQAYKQAGNSVTVSVIEAIGRRIRAADAELHNTEEGSEICPTMS